MPNETREPDIYDLREITLKENDLPFRVTEAVNTLRGNIQLSGYNIKMIGITSAMMHEGKSTVALLLARSFAALDKRTLFIDCDIRNSHLLQRYNVRTKVTGLTEYLCGEFALNDIIYMTSEKNLEIIFTGQEAPNPSELFSGERFRALLKTVRESYDYVILDTAPVNTVIDGVLIARECDGTVMVVESGVTDRVQSQRAKQQLKYANVKLLGVVLNKLGSRKSGYGYGYGYGYGHDYGYGEDKASDGKKKNKR